MKVTAPMEVDRKASVPLDALSIVDYVSGKLTLRTPAEKPVVITFCNTICHRHRRDETDEQVLIQLDWAKFERVMMFGHFFWEMQGGRLWRQKIVSYLEQEMLLVGSRMAALQGSLSEAINLQRAYENFEFRDQLPRQFDIYSQSQELMWFIVFAAFRELVRPAASADEDRIRRLVLPTIRDHSPEVVGDNRLLRDIYLDNRGFDGILDYDREPVQRGVVGELLHYVVIDELSRKTADGAEMLGVSAFGFENAVKAAGRNDQQVRFNFLYNRALEGAGQASDQDTSEKLEATARMAQEFDHLLKLAFSFGWSDLRKSN